MGVPTSEVGYTLATAGRGDYKVHKGRVVALEQKKERKVFNHSFPFAMQVHRTSNYNSNKLQNKEQYQVSL
jgi:hypothetical protein